MKHTGRYILLVLLLGVLPVRDGSAENVREQWRKNVSMAFLNGLLTADLNADSENDIVLTDIKGQIKALFGKNGRTFWARKLTEDPLTEPLVGDFLCDGSYDILIGTKNGRIFLLDGATGRVVSRFKPSQVKKFILPPSLMEYKTGEDMVRDGIVIGDNSGRVFFYVISHTDPLELKTIWQVTLPLVLRRPISIGDVTGDGYMDVVCVATEGRILVIDGLEGTIVCDVKPGTHDIITVPALANLDNKGGVEIVYGDRHGEVWCLTYNGISLESYLTLASPKTPIETDPILADINNDGTVDILVATQKDIFTYNGKDGSKVWTEEQEQVLASGRIISNLGLIQVQNKGAHIAFVDSRAMLHIVTPQGERYARFPLRTLYTGVPLVFDSGGDKGADIFLINNETGQCGLFATGLNVLKNKISWQTLGGNQFRSCRWENYYFNIKMPRIEYKQITFIEKTLDEAQQLSERGRWTETINAAEKVLELNPIHPRARGLKSNAQFKKNFNYIVAGVIVLIIGCLVSACLIGRAYLMKRLFRSAQELVLSSNLQNAIRVYRRILRISRDNPIAIKKIAQTLIKVQDFSSAAGKIYEKALYEVPESTEFLRALATVYSRERNMSDRAFEIYNRAYQLVGNPARLEFLLGKIYQKRGNLEKAAQLIRHSMEDETLEAEAISTLVDLYVEMGHKSERALFFFEHVYEQRKDDPRFLKAFCETIIHAQVTTDTALEIIERMLEVIPGFTPAEIHKAKIQIKKGMVNEAAIELDKLLKEEPDNPDVLLLLGQCYLIDNRTDEFAIQTYTKVLRHFPEDKDILRALSHIYSKQGMKTKEAYDLYKKAYHFNPNDVHIIRTLLECASDNEEYELAIECGERLLEMGEKDVGVLTLLAASYQATRVTEEKAEPVYRQMVTLYPENTEYLILLAQTLLEADKTDGASLPVYEAAYDVDHDNIPIARQLAKTYLTLDMFDNALELTSSLLNQGHDDEETKRLYAYANLSKDRLDEAIREYEKLYVEIPGDKTVLVNLAIALSRKKALDSRALDIYHKALEADPQESRVHRIKAMVHASRSETKETIESLRTAIKCDESIVHEAIKDLQGFIAESTANISYRWYLCSLLIEHNYHREAIEQLQSIYQLDSSNIDTVLSGYDKILAKDSQNYTAYHMKGRLLKEKGDIDSAKEETEKAARLRPGNPDILSDLAEIYERKLQEKENVELRFSLGKIYLSLKDSNRAIACFQKSVQDYRFETESLKLLGICFVKKDMLDLALAEFSKLLVDDEMKDILYDLGIRFEKKGDLIGAKTVYKQLFAADIDFKDVRKKFELLSHTTSDPLMIEKTAIIEGLSEAAKRRYDLLSEVGRGAMGIVYRAHDNELDEPVALKILPDNLSKDPDAVARFKAEARSARRLSHQNIVRIHDIGEELGRKYISMEYVEGTDLKRIIRAKGKLLPKETIHYAMEIARALGYAHRMGIVHRDIKPANIMISTQNQVKITDFGIAKIIESSDMTLAGSVIGTPLYMSPEQVQGKPADNRSDIYSLGILLYELVEGNPPFTEGDLSHQHLNVVPPRPQNVPDSFVDVIMRCLEKDAGNRYQTAEDLIFDLEKILVNDPEFSGGTTNRK